MNNKFKKSLAITTVIAAAVSCSFFAYSKIQENKEPSQVQLATIERSSSASEWWNRKDYVCVAVTCINLLAQYDSDVAKKVEDGKGTVAHTWNCSGCPSGWGFQVKE